MTNAKASKLWLGVLIGGGIAATLAIVYACVRNAGFGRSPTWTIQSMASPHFSKVGLARTVSS